MMPRFTGRNKKRKDPRYFLFEEVEPEDPPWGDGGYPASGEDPMARASALAQKGMSSLSDDESIEDEAEDLEAIASSLRTYEKDLTGRKGSFLSDEEMATMSKEDLIQYIKTVMDTSPEAADLEAEFQAQDDRAMGYEDELDPAEMEPKMEPMGRTRRRGMRENNGRTSK